MAASTRDSTISIFVVPEIMSFTRNCLRFIIPVSSHDTGCVFLLIEKRSRRACQY